MQSVAWNGMMQWRVNESFFPRFAPVLGNNSFGRDLRHRFILPHCVAMIDSPFSFPGVR